MSEVTRNNLPPAEPIEDKDMQPIGHGDKLEHAVEHVAERVNESPAQKAERLKGDEVME
jgi:hypothetical protein